MGCIPERLLMMMMMMRLEGTQLTIRFERINNNVARVYFVDQFQAQQAVPANITMQDGSGAVVAPFLNNFLVSWGVSFTLLLNNHPYMYLNQEKQQSIMGPAEAQSGIVE